MDVYGMRREAATGLILLVFGQLVAAGDPAGSDTASTVIQIGSRLELFVDTRLVDTCRAVEAHLHHPVSREVALRFDAPWEGPVSTYVGLFADGHRYRMYYRGGGAAQHDEEVTCYAESLDGVHWVKPDLGLCEHHGSYHNNIVLTGEGTHCLAVFKDGNGKAPPEERYKAVSAGQQGGRPCLIAFVSADGLHWRRMRDEPIITTGAFDSQNLAFWDAAQGRYAAYVRDFRDGVRSIRRSLSEDFLNWSEPQWLDFGDAPAEHLYTNAIQPYSRAPGLYVGMPMRFVPDRRFHAGHPHVGAADGVFMASRDGLHWTRYRQAFIRPGPDPGNWTDRSNMPAWGILPTGDHEMSVYWIEHYRTADTRLRRGTLRLDGFVSMRAGPEGGEFVTRPLRFDGDRLVLNYATSAAGGIRVEIQDAAGEPLEGYRLEDAVEMFGDELERPAAWKHGGNVGKLTGQAIRLRFAMADADLYAIRFVPAGGGS